jgi:ribosomal 50S subunit-recycling heat shock protein
MVPTARLNIVSRPLSLAPSAISNLIMCRTSAPVMMHQRYKKKKAAAGKEQDDKSDDEDSDTDEGGDEQYERDWDEVDTIVAGSQIDLIIRSVFNMSREKAIVMCNEGLVRLNGRTAVKTDNVSDFDVIDIIIGRDPEDPDKLRVRRGEITHISDIAATRGRNKLKAKRWKLLTIENYPEDRYEGVLLYKEEEPEEWRGRIKTDEDK